MLALNIAPETEPLVFSVARELTADDLALAERTDKQATTPPLKQLRARHHAIAKALADGMRPGVVAATYGYSNSRISILMNDPSFKELVAHYRAEAHYDSAVIRQRLTALGVDALDALQERLDDEDVQVPTGQLLKIAELALDRTGHGKKAETEVNVFVGLADRLRAARERVQPRLIPETSIIDVDSIEV